MTGNDKKRLLELLADLYPDPRSELNFKNDLQLIVAVILSAQCTDKKVNEVTPALFRKFSTFRKLAAADVQEVETIIRPVNYYRTKAKNIVAMANAVVNEHKGKLPARHEELLTLPGVGRKTANVIQCEKGEVPAFPVDTHVFRVARRLGLACGKNPDQVEEQLRREFDPGWWHNLHHWLILHGRRVCKAPRPRCGECGIALLCPSRKLFEKRDALRPLARTRAHER